MRSTLLVAMKNKLFKFAIVYNLVNTLFIIHMKTLHEEGSFIYSIILPVFWLISFVLFYEICSKQIGWLKRNFVTALLLTCLCVPIFPIIIIELIP